MIRDDRLVALVGALFLALMALWWESSVISLLPRNADLSWNVAFTQSQPSASPAVTRYGK